LPAKIVLLDWINFIISAEKTSQRQTTVIKAKANIQKTIGFSFHIFSSSNK